MTQSILLAIGSGRCGSFSLARVLNQQPGVQVSHEDPPMLPWKREEGAKGGIHEGHEEHEGGKSEKSVKGEKVLRERFARFRRTRNGQIVGDVASFYLPYVEDAIAVEPTIRIVCLKRPREEVVQSFCRWLDQVFPLRMNHWAERPAPGWHHDPNWTRIFPQYAPETPEKGTGPNCQNGAAPASHNLDQSPFPAQSPFLDREEGIRRYWDEYYQKVEELIGRYPEHIRLYDYQRALNTEEGLRELLAFVGIPREQQVVTLGTHLNRPEKGTGPISQNGPPGAVQKLAQSPFPGRSRAKHSSNHPLDPRKCVILVPFTSHIIPPCENALRELERRGYDVRRVGGYAAIDQGRNQMATDALIDGYEETMWIDADVEFHPDSVERLREHNLPIVCGIYAYGWEDSGRDRERNTTFTLNFPDHAPQEAPAGNGRAGAV